MLLYGPFLISSLMKFLAFSFTSSIDQSVNSVTNKTSHRIIPQISNPIDFLKSDLVQYICRLLTGCLPKTVMSQSWKRMII